MATILQNIDTILAEYDVSKNTSSFIMTKYEKTNVLGLRIEQLSFGSKTLLDEKDLEECVCIEDVAQMELKKGLLPFIVQRQICDREFEYFKVKDMIILD